MKNHMKTQRILTILLITLIFLTPIATSVQAVERYTRITGNDPFYIITGESTNNSNTHFNYYRIELNPTTYEIINKTKILSSDLAYSTGGQPATPYYYNNRLVLPSGIYDIETLQELPQSIADLTSAPDYDYITSSYVQDRQNTNFYNPLTKHYYRYGLYFSGTFQGRLYADDYYYNSLYSAVTGTATPSGAFHPFSNGALMRRTTTSAGLLYYPDGINTLSAGHLPGAQEAYSFEKIGSGGNDPAYYYYGVTGSDDIRQVAMNNVSTLIRTITPTIYPKSFTPVSSRSNYLYSAGFYRITGTPNRDVASIEVRDRNGVLVTGSNSIIANSSYNRIIELETGDIALIFQNTDTNNYNLQIKNTISLNTLETIDYNTTQLWSISSKLTNRKGIDPQQFIQISSGVYSREKGGFDAVPKMAYTYLLNGTEPTGVTITDIDLTNRILSFDLELSGDIDYYNIPFLVDDDDFKTTTNEKYGYMIPSDYSIVNTISTGLITSSDTYNFTTALSNNRFYIMDINATILNTTATPDYVVGLFAINGDPLFTLFNRVIYDNQIQLVVPYGVPPYIEELQMHVPHLITYPDMSGSAHDYSNLKVFIDKYNNRYSISLKTYYEDSSVMDAGFINWVALPTGTDSITSLLISLTDNTSMNVDIDVYRTASLPKMNTKSADTTYYTSKVMNIPILDTGANKVLVSYSDYSTSQIANFQEWTININTIGGDIIGIGPSGDIDAPIVGNGLVSDDYLIFGGIIPNFMGTPANTTMFISLMLMVLVLIVGVIIGAGAGMIVIGFFVGLGFVFMMAIYFAIIGWLPAWIPIVAFVMTALIGANSIRNAFTGSGG